MTCSTRLRGAGHDEPIFESAGDTYGVGHGGFVDFRRRLPVVARLPLQERPSRRLAAYDVRPADRRRGLRHAVLGSPRGGRHHPAGPGRQPRAQVPKPDLGLAGRGVVDFDYYGHHQFFDGDRRGLDLGRVPPSRSTTSAALRSSSFATATTRTSRSRSTSTCSTRNAQLGVLFRTTAPTDRLRHTTRLLRLPGARHSQPRPRSHRRRAVDNAGDGEASGAARPVQRLTVTAEGDHLSVTCSGAAIDTHDDHYTRGSVGVRVVECHARFLQLSVKPL